MPSFNVDTDKITAFDFAGTHLFTARIDEQQLFNQLKRYYDRDKYRLKIPEGDLEEVQQMLDNYLFELLVEDTPGKYCVVANKETDTSTILRNSVMGKQCGEHDIYPMNNKLSVKQAVEQGSIQVKIGCQHSEYRTENQRIIAGPVARTSVDTNRYKYLPDSHLTKRIES